MLSEIGLTDYEIRAYMELLKYDETNAKTIYTKANIPFGKIYSTLDSLNGKGFVEVLNTKPKKYRAVEPEIALKKYTQNQESWFSKKITSLKETVSDLMNEFSSKKLQNKNEKIFWTTDLDEDKIDRINNLLFYDPKISVDIFLHEVNVRFASKILDKIEKALDGSVDFRLIMTRDTLDQLKLDKDYSKLIAGNKIKVKTVNKINSYFGIVDKKTVLFLNLNPLSESKISSIVTIWNKDLANNLSKEFDNVWGKAANI